jgi:hypothetical protein
MNKGIMNKRTFLRLTGQSSVKLMGLVTLAALSPVSVYSHSINAGSDRHQQAKTGQLSEAFMGLSAHLLARNNLPSDEGKLILSCILQAKKFALLDKLTVQYSFFKRYEADSTEQSFFDYLKNQKQMLDSTELLQLGKDIVYAWYTGIARFDVNHLQRLTYETSLQYSINKDIYIPSSYCGGEFGYWQQKATSSGRMA